MTVPDDPCMEAWKKFTDGLREAGKQMDAYTAEFDPVERADGFRAISRVLAANLEKLEADGQIPEVVRDNTPNHKWFMDNPDGLYWHAVIDPKQSYRIKGNLGEACYTSITVYKRGAQWFQTGVSASIDDSELMPNDDGEFELSMGGDRPVSGAWLPLEDGAWLLWIRQFFEDVHNDKPGWFSIEDQDPINPPVIEPERFAKRLGVMGEMVKQITALTIFQARNEAKQAPNQVRRWEEMQAGAVYTLAGTDYMRGSWRLAPGQALVIEGKATPCKHWNVVLYSRFLNSLEHRRRPVSLTGSRIKTGPDGSYRLVIAHADPGVPNWLDTEGREFGMFVIRWLFPEGDTVVPTTRVAKLDELGE